MQILHVVDSLNAVTGGPARSITRLADALQAEGATSVIVAHDYAEHAGLILPEHAEARLLPARRRPLRLGAQAQGFREALIRESEKADIIHSHGLWLPVNREARVVAQKRGIPLVISTRGMLEPWALRHRSLRKRLAWLLWEQTNLRAAAALHATSEEETQSIRQAGLDQPVAMIPNGVDLREQREPRATLEAAFPELRGQRWLLFLSRLHVKKGLDLLLASWTELAATHPDWSLVIAGAGMDGEEDSFRAQVRSMTRVSLVGELQGAQKFSALDGCSLFVLPSRSENFGIAVAEALAAARPVIATTATPWKEVSEHGCGWWIPCEQQALQQTLREAMGRPEENLQVMGERGRGLMARRYAWKSVAQSMKTLYEWLRTPSSLPPSCCHLP